MKRTWLLVVLLGVVGLIVWIAAITPTRNASTRPLPPDPNEEGVPLSPAAVQAAKDQMEWDKRDKKKDPKAALVFAIFAAKDLRKSMRNPDSFKLSEAALMDDGTACFTYRAQNGFGGLNVERAVWYPGSLLGNTEKNGSRPVLKTQAMSGFKLLWNKKCADRTGVDKTEEIAALLP